MLKQTIGGYVAILRWCTNEHFTGYSYPRNVKGRRCLYENGLLRLLLRSDFVLLDHMDWLSAQPRLLEEEWRCIIEHAEPGARIIYRSGSVTCDYIPEYARRRLQFQSDQTNQWHRRDRVGTYASFHFAKVTP